uniref:Uncharacterized protein n=1 Tax=Micrurus surinamensis TaxID=129470 RepID=A0A2D4NV64_MICSU
MGVSAPAAWSAVIHLSSMLAIEEMANVTQLYLFQIQKQAYFKSGSGLQNLHDQWHATIIYFLKNVHCQRDSMHQILVSVYSINLQSIVQYLHKCQIFNW